MGFPDKKSEIFRLKERTVSSVRSGYCQTWDKITKIIRYVYFEDLYTIVI